MTVSPPTARDGQKPSLPSGAPSSDPNASHVPSAASRATRTSPLGSIPLPEPASAHSCAARGHRHVEGVPARAGLAPGAPVEAIDPVLLGGRARPGCWTPTPRRTGSAAMSPIPPVGARSALPGVVHAVPSKRTTTLRSTPSTTLTPPAQTAPCGVPRQRAGRAQLLHADRRPGSVSPPTHATGATGPQLVPDLQDLALGTLPVGHVGVLRRHRDVDQEPLAVEQPDPVTAVEPHPGRLGRGEPPHRGERQVVGGIPDRRHRPLRGPPGPPARDRPPTPSRHRRRATSPSPVPPARVSPLGTRSEDLPSGHCAAEPPPDPPAHPATSTAPRAIPIHARVHIAHLRPGAHGPHTPHLQRITGAPRPQGACVPRPWPASAPGPAGAGRTSAPAGCHAAPRAPTGSA